MPRETFQLDARLHQQNIETLWVSSPFLRQNRPLKSLHGGSIVERKDLRSKAFSVFLVNRLFTSTPVYLYIKGLSFGMAIGEGKQFFNFPIGTMD